MKQAEEDEKERQIITATILVLSSLSSLLPINFQIISSSFSLLTLDTSSSCYFFLSVSSPSGQTSYSGSTLLYL